METGLASNNLIVSYIILFSVFASLFGGTFLVWLRFKKKKNVFPKVILLIPIGIIFSMMLVLSQKISWDIESLHQATDRSTEKIVNNKWEFIENYIQEAQAESFLLSESIALEVITDVKKLPQSEVDNYLANIGKQKNNPIQNIVGNRIQGKYFRGNVSDANDPFAMIIGKDEKDSFLFADFSENCAVDELTRSLFIEYELQGREGNSELAHDAFGHLLNLNTGKPLSETIFFQFAKKDSGVPLSSYDFDGIKHSYYMNKGDIKSTFQSLEFLAPYYIYRDRSIGGTLRVEDRVKTDAKIIAIVSVYSLYETINNDPYALRILNQYDDLQKHLKSELIREERIILIIGILIMLIAFLMFMLFWGYMQFIHCNIEGTKYSCE